MRSTSSPSSRRARDSAAQESSCRRARASRARKWNSPGCPRRRRSARARPPSAERAADRPARQHFREFRDVGLRVAAVDAERVQLQDLAREILVQAELAAAVAAHERRGRRARAHRGLVVEIQDHRGMPLGREQQIVEIARHVRPDRFLLVQARERGERLLVGRHREVVAPEVHEPLDERPIRFDREPMPLAPSARRSARGRTSPNSRIACSSMPGGRRRRRCCSLRAARTSLPALAPRLAARRAARAPRRARARTRVGRCAGGAARRRSSCASSQPCGSAPIAPASPGRAPSPKRFAAMAASFVNIDDPRVEGALLAGNGRHRVSVYRARSLRTEHRVSPARADP